jgi:hypothetical protein
LGRSNRAVAALPDRRNSAARLGRPPGASRAAGRRGRARTARCRREGGGSTRAGPPRRIPLPLAFQAAARASSSPSRDPGSPDDAARSSFEGASDGGGGGLAAPPHVPTSQIGETIIRPFGAGDVEPAARPDASDLDALPGPAHNARSWPGRDDPVAPPHRPERSPPVMSIRPRRLPPRSAWSWEWRWAGAYRPRAPPWSAPAAGTARANRSRRPARSWSATTKGSRCRSRTTPCIISTTRGASPGHGPHVEAIGRLEQADRHLRERDLVADFKIDLENGPKPRFLMTTGSLGSYSDGWAPLYVFESTTNRLAIYRVQQLSVGTNSRPTVRPGGAPLDRPAAHCPPPRGDEPADPPDAPSPGAAQAGVPGTAPGAAPAAACASSRGPPLRRRAARPGVAGATRPSGRRRARRGTRRRGRAHRSRSSRDLAGRVLEEGEPVVGRNPS